jgi:creatinine amidohydrolase
VPESATERRHTRAVRVRPGDGSGAPCAAAHRGVVRLALAVALAAGCLVPSPPACAGHPDSVFLEALTWTDVRAAVSEGTTTVLVPVGGTEQNGPHMALGKHNVRARLLAERIARALGDALVAPVVAYVPEGDPAHPSGHLRYPGTISIPSAAFVQMLESTVLSFKAHGFRTVVLLGDHGGYQAELVQVERRFEQPGRGGPFRVVACREYYRASQEAFADILAGRGYSRAEIGRHAGLLDTSLMLALDPSMVRTDRIGARHNGAADGIDGDPARSSAELGRIGVEAIVSRTVDAIRAARGSPR